MFRMEGRLFGDRKLVDPESVFEHNAWDNITWDATQKLEAESKIGCNSKTKVGSEKAALLEENAGLYWEDFYEKHQNKFFKNRMWLFKEFPQLLLPTTNRECNTSLKSCSNPYPGSNAEYRLFEVGCGVGNTIFPVLKEAVESKSNVFLYACDFASNAIDIVKSHPEYSPEVCHAFVCDISSSELIMPFPQNSLDVITLIFVLSALHPTKVQSTVSQLVRYLKPGGLFLFRDYGKYDLAQLRFKDGQCIDDNFYVRQDQTRVYFFTEEELHAMFVKAGLEKEANFSDRRLIVNRQKKLTMSRVWIQCRYKKK